MPLHLVRSLYNDRYKAAENWFFCLNDLNEPVSQGYLMVLRKDDLYPDRPLNVFMNMLNMNNRGAVIGRELLFGALMACANKIRLMNPGVPMRLFSQLNIADEDAIAFYRAAGFDVETSFLELCEIQIPDAQSTRQLGCMCSFTPIRSATDVDELLNRIQRTQRVPLEQKAFHSTFEQDLCWPVNVTTIWGSSKKVVGEAVFRGDGKGNALLSALYANPEIRGNGLEQAMMAFGMKHLMESKEISHFYAYRQTNIPCEQEMATTSAKVIQRELCYPERLYG